MTRSNALLLFKGKQATLTDRQITNGIADIQIAVPSGQDRNEIKVKGHLHIVDEIVVAACRPWDYAETEDSELARVLFAAVNGSASAETSQRAILSTSVERKPDGTVEYLTIQIGQREIDVIRKEAHRSGHTLFAVLVNECLFKPGYGPLVPAELVDKH